MSSITDQNILHIVNDASTATAISEGGIGGDILVWQDALYEGPATDYKDLDKFAKERAKYFAARGYGSYADIERAYLTRNQNLQTFPNYREIILWFDHDLFGQLQLVQLVSWFNQQDTGSVEISLVHLEHLTSGRVTPRMPQLLLPQVAKLFQTRTEVTLHQTNICQAAWNAFTATSPKTLTSFYPKDLSTMPFIKNAFARLLQEYPSKQTGLSRTEYLIVDAVKNKNLTEESIFSYVQRKEPVPFMSKTIFMHHLNEFLNAQQPVIKKMAISKEAVLEMDDNEQHATENTVVHDYKITLTSHTNQVLNKWSDWIQLNGINRWIGGVHLNDGAIWRYDPISRQLNKTYA